MCRLPVCTSRGWMRTAAWSRRVVTNPGAAEWHSAECGLTNRGEVQTASLHLQWRRIPCGRSYLPSYSVLNGSSVQVKYSIRCSETGSSTSSFRAWSRNSVNRATAAGG